MFRFVRKFASKSENIGSSGKTGKIKNSIDGVLNSYASHVILTGGAICAAGVTMGGVGSCLNDWATGAREKDSQALNAWRVTKIEAMTENTAQLKAINANMSKLTEVLELNKPAPKEVKEPVGFLVEEPVPVWHFVWT